ncbi:hypothetical protein SAMN04487944_1303 [Gracilibacillus ureilyticus]|uniref:Uncharacterized protein n=1 Tax=Gracilibacillus ureilyticus TaxID=531814 RepID=A0A1H9VYG0_9BACI|nr:hypothetical protein SAMN04487944_1303 [Gracilibacillus ureilyticus]
MTLIKKYTSLDLRAMETGPHMDKYPRRGSGYLIHYLKIYCISRAKRINTTLIDYIF